MTDEEDATFTRWLVRDTADGLYLRLGDVRGEAHSRRIAFFEPEAITAPYGLALPLLPAGYVHQLKVAQGATMAHLHKQLPHGTPRGRIGPLKWPGGHPVRRKIMREVN